MRNLSVRFAFLFTAFSLMALSSYSQKSNEETWTKMKATQWMKSGVWKNGLRAKAHASVNPVEFAEQYNKNKAIWDKALAFLNRKDLETLAPGKYPIDGDLVYAMVNEFDTKEFDKTKWESHRRYIDLQYMIRGKEKIGVAPVAGAKVTEAYDEANDIAHYETSGKYYVAEPGTFFLFFPQEAHRPDVAVGSPAHVRKLVIKISEAK